MSEWSGEKNLRGIPVVVAAWGGGAQKPVGIELLHGPVEVVEVGREDVVGVVGVVVVGDRPDSVAVVAVWPVVLAGPGPKPPPAFARARGRAVFGGWVG